MLKFLHAILAFFFATLKCQNGALTVNELNAIGNDLIGQVSDGVFTGNVFLKRLREKQEIKSGGNQIKMPLNTVDDTSSNVQSYDSRDDLNLNEFSAFSASVHDWKLNEATLVLYNLDIAKNGSPQGIVDLMTERAKQIEMAFTQHLSKQVFSDGTASTGDGTTTQLVGLQAAIDSTSTSYGGISSTDLASWVSYESSTIGTLALADLNDLFDEATEPNKFGPSVAVYDKDVLTAHKGLLSTFQRAAAESSLDGFGHGKMSLIYSGIPHLVDNQCPSGEIYYIDEEYLKLCVHKDNNMRVENYDKLETKDAFAKRIFLYANIVAKQRLPHAVGSGITG